jgi:hypothetical protein
VLRELRSFLLPALLVMPGFGPAPPAERGPGVLVEGTPVALGAMVYDISALAYAVVQAAGERIANGLSEISIEFDAGIAQATLLGLAIRAPDCRGSGPAPPASAQRWPSRCRRVVIIPTRRHPGGVGAPEPTRPGPGPSGGFAKP